MSAASGVIFETDNGKAVCFSLESNGDGKIASDAINRGACKQVEHDREKGITVKDCGNISNVYNICLRNKGRFYTLGD